MVLYWTLSRKLAVFDNCIASLLNSTSDTAWEAHWAEVDRSSILQWIQARYSSEGLNRIAST